MKLNKMIAVALGMVLASSSMVQLGVIEAASKIISGTKAKEIMLKKVPGAKVVKFKLDYDSTPEYEAELIKESYKYEIAVNAKNGKITELKKEKIQTSTEDLIGEEKAKEIMLEKVPGAQIVEFELDTYKIPKYEGELKKGKYQYEIEVDALTGEITKFKKGKAKVTVEDLIGEEKAKEIMLEKVPGGKITKFKLDNDDEEPKYEGKVKKGKYQYEIEVDALTGEVTKFKKGKAKVTAEDLIGEEKAKEIMLEKVPGGKITKFKLDNDDKKPEYEGKVKKGKYQYEIEVNALTGEMTKFKKK